MKKRCTLFLAIVSTSLAYSWDYLGTKGTGNGEDFEISTNGDVYVADYDAGLTGSNILLRVKKFNGSSWENLPNASEGSIIGTAVDIELSGSDIYISYAEFVNFSYYSVFVKKYENNKWVQVSTSLRMPTGGASIFDLVVDSDGVCYVLGAAGPSSTTAKIHKLVNNQWSAITIPNAQGPTFHDRSSYIDANKDLIFPISKYLFVNGGLASEISVLKLSGTTITSLGNTVSTTKGGTYNKLRVLSNGTIKLVTSDNSVNTFYTLESNVWTVNPIETTIGISTNADIDIDGKWYFANASKIFEEGNTTAIYTPTSGVVADIKLYDGNIYALVSDGVIKQPVISATGLENGSSFENEMAIYPIPTSEKLNTFSQLNNYAIFNSFGVLIEKGTISGNSINVSQLDNGVYYLQLSGNGTTSRTKFIKQ